jgi:hypothetical protein
MSLACFRVINWLGSTSTFTSHLEHFTFLYPSKMQTLLSTLLVISGLVGFGSPDPVSQYSDLVPSGLLMDPYIFVQALEEVAAAGAGSLYQQGRKLQQDPDFICNQFNTAAGGTLDCTCSRYDRRDTLIACDYVNTTCNAEGDICFDATVNIVVDLDAKSKAVTQCTYYLKEANETASDTCITVYPASLGNYTELDSCYTSLNTEACNFCYISDTPDVTLSPIAVTFDCCNVVDDIKSTDNPVGGNGGAIALFDEITEGDEGQCKGKNKPPNGKTATGAAPGGSIGGGNGNGDESGATDSQSGGMTLLVGAMTVAMVGAGWL